MDRVCRGNGLKINNVPLPTLMMKSHQGWTLPKGYGGPFETEVVEDVKTLLRIVLMMHLYFYWKLPPPICSHSLVFIWEGTCTTLHQVGITYTWTLFESGLLSTFIIILAVPVYILLVYPYIKKWVPRIIVRLGIGILFKVASVLPCSSSRLWLAALDFTMVQLTVLASFCLTIFLTRL